MAEIFDGAEFVTVRYRTNTLHTKIMQTGGHMYVASVYFINQNRPDKLAEFRAKQDRKDLMAQVPGYSIYLLPCDTLDGERIGRSERKAILEKMAKYYYYTWIINNPEGFIAHKETISE